MLYDTILVTDKGFVFALLHSEQLERIERAYRTNRNISVIVRMENGREVEANHILLCLAGGSSEDSYYQQG